MFFTRRKADRFVNRGDPDSVDFPKESFTCDSTWRTLDFSNIIPKGTKAILVLVTARSGAVGDNLMFRTNNNSNEINCAYIKTLSAVDSMTPDKWLVPDINGIIQYNGSTKVWDNIEVTVRGWIV